MGKDRRRAPPIVGGRRKANGSLVAGPVLEGVLVTLCGMGPSLNNIKNDFVSQWVATMSGARPARLGRRSKIAQRDFVDFLELSSHGDDVGHRAAGL